MPTTHPDYLIHPLVKYANASSSVAANRYSRAERQRPSRTQLQCAYVLKIDIKDYSFIINFALYLHVAIAIDPVFVCNVRARRQQAHYVMTLMHIQIHRIHRATLLKTHAHCDYTVFRCDHNIIKYSHSECIYYYYYNACIRVSLTRVLHSIAFITI